SGYCWGRLKGVKEDYDGNILSSSNRKMAKATTDADGSDINRRRWQRHQPKKMAATATGRWQRQQPRQMAATATEKDGSDSNRRR
ncbi:hypothetical protein GW17_00058887, partial [Ensete ventricosum]